MSNQRRPVHFRPAPVSGPPALSPNGETTQSSETAQPMCAESPGKPNSAHTEQPMSAREWRETVRNRPRYVAWIDPEVDDFAAHRTAALEQERDQAVSNANESERCRQEEHRAREAAEQRITQLLGLLREHGRHVLDCPCRPRRQYEATIRTDHWLPGDEQKCTCYFAEALELRRKP